MCHDPLGAEAKSSALMLTATKVRLTRPNRHDYRGLYRSFHGSSLLAVLRVPGSKSGRSRAGSCSSAPATNCLLPAWAAHHSVSCPIKQIHLIGHCNAEVALLCQRPEIVKGYTYMSENTQYDSARNLGFRRIEYDLEEASLQTNGSCTA